MRSRGALVDSNLLLVLVIGSVDPTLILRFKRTKSYSEADFNLLASELSLYDYVVTTPSILAEVSNYLGQLQSPDRETARQQLRVMIAAWQEHYRHSETLMRDSEYVRLGLTDAGICDAAQLSGIVFTADFDLYSSLSRRGLHVINFNHLRSQRFGL